MKVLIGTDVNGLYFKPGLVKAIIEATGTKYVSEISPLSLYSETSEVDFETFQMFQDAAIIDDQLYFLVRYDDGEGTLASFRTDPIVHDLFDVFEAIDGEDNKLVDVPDDVMWYIGFGDFGNEFVAEEHRVWS